MLVKALSIAGFDSSGGAGLQADLKTFSALGCYGMTVLTALPIQNTMGVSNCYPIPLSAISEQLESVFNDIVPDVIKIGMLFSSEIIDLVADFIKQYAMGIPLVIDPVMVAKSGDLLLEPGAIATLNHKLLPLATIVTPNLDEAAVMAEMKINSREDMLLAARKIFADGTQAVLVKGGHFAGNECDDLLYMEEKYQWFGSKRIDSKNTHGTGCTLSAAIAAGLGHGLSIASSCLQAKNYIYNALLDFQHEQIGFGHGPVNHFYKLWSTNAGSFI